MKIIEQTDFRQDEVLLQVKLYLLKLQLRQKKKLWYRPIQKNYLKSLQKKLIINVSLEKKKKKIPQPRLQIQQKNLMIALIILLIMIILIPQDRKAVCKDKLDK